MDRAQIDRWNGRRRLALAGVCIARATFINAAATDAQNQPVDDLQRLPIANSARSGSEPALP